jgi:hypothetical protein
MSCMPLQGVPGVPPFSRPARTDRGSVIAMPNNRYITTGIGCIRLISQISKYFDTAHTAFRLVAYSVVLTSSAVNWFVLSWSRMTMARNSRPWGQISLLLTTSLLLYILLFFRNSISLPYGRRFGVVFPETGTSSQALFNTLNLSSQQCHAAFPNLTHDIGVNVALGPFTLPPPESGPLQVRIRDGQVPPPSPSVLWYTR